MVPIVEEIFLALDRGEDTTSDSLKEFPKLKIIESKWDMTITKGHVLSVETNKALKALREVHSSDGKWGIYLQADEVLHEDDYELLISDIEKAEATGCDALSFRYLHFWQTHHHLAIAKNWYPEEIRAIKLNSSVVSYGDAQSFKNHQKVYQSEARIFHYGHVRDQSIYKNKMEDMSKLYDSDAKKSKYYNEKDRDKNYTDCVLYYGTHPKWMKDRILRMGDIWCLPELEKVYLIGEKSNYSESVLNSINSKQVIWIHNKKEAITTDKSKIVNLKIGFLDKIFKRSHVPSKMKSKIARNWSNDFVFILKLSEKEIGFK
jgi:hypothetical protein